MSLTKGQRLLLERELSRWVSEGIVSAEQRDQILALYPEKPAAPPPAKASSRIPAILIGMAVLLVGVGLILFYAANWRKMAPGFKLAQVLAMVVGTYAGSYWLLFRRHPLPLAGRGLLLIGLLAYGAAIGLIAQIFHISAHPSNGVLAWLIGALLLSAVMEERWGYYLSAVLAMVWNGWEVFEYDRANVLFIAFPALLGWLFYRKGDAAGVLVAALEAVFWFYQVNIHRAARPDEMHAALGLLFLHVPLGVVLIGLQRRIDDRVLRPTAALLGILGWIFIFAPLIGLSWPLPLKDIFYFTQPGMLFFALEHLLLAGAAAALLRRLPDAGLLWAALGFSLLCLFGPSAHKIGLLVLTHLGLLGLLLGLLHTGWAGERRTTERVLAPFFSIVALLAKGIGLLAMGLIHSRYYLAYCLGFVVFATVLFLINQLVRSRLARYPAGLLDASCASSIFLMLYAVSFRVPEQSPVFDAEAVVLVLLALFVLLALLLYAVLWRRGGPRLLLGLSALVFVIALGVLLLARPGVPWEAYSAIFNLLLLFIDGALLYYSVRVNSVVLANISLAAVVLQVVTRYIDIFWDLLSGSLLFIITGILVFGGGFFLERNRRRLVEHIRRSAPTEGGDR